MPTYEYLCGQCGKKFEQFQSITAKPVRKCPACGRRSVRRLIGAGAGVIFKGSGFYQTDYRSDSYRKSAEKEKPPTASPSSSEGAGKSSSEGAGKGASEASGKSPAKGEGASAKKKE